MKGLVSVRLMVMMFLQFFIWGAYYVTAATFIGGIGFEGSHIGTFYAVGPIAGILSPFFVGMIADRFFATERILGFLHLVGGALMLYMTQQMGLESPTPDRINLIFFGYMLTFYPTLSLVNTLALHNLDDAGSQFPIVRVFGTIGWILAGWSLGWLGWGDKIQMFYLAAFSAILLGFYCFTLPHTPPPMRGQKIRAAELIGYDAFSLFRNGSFQVFMICSFLICIPLAFYYQLAARSLEQTGVGASTVATQMTYGQISEIIFMLAIPLLFRQLGVKWMLLIGMGAWVLRYLLFAFGAPQPNPTHWMMMAGIILHGICYDFFFVTGQIYTDQVAPERIRGQAQGMLVLFTLGIGMFIGAKCAGYIEDRCTPEEARALKKQVTALGKDIKKDQAELDKLLSMKKPGFKNKLANIHKKIEEMYQDVKTSSARPVPLDRIEAYDLKFQSTTSDDSMIQALVLKGTMADRTILKAEKNLQSMQLIDWKKLWLFPAIGAAIVLGFFFITFHDRPEDPVTVPDKDYSESSHQGSEESKS